MVKLNNKTRQEYTKSVLEALRSEDMMEFRALYLALHPSDQQDIFQLMNELLRKRTYNYLSPKEFAGIFSGLKKEVQFTIVQEVNEIFASQMLDYMFTDNVVSFLLEIKKDRREDILRRMKKEKADKIRTLLSYKEETAGSIMTKELLRIKTYETAELVIEHLREEAIDAEIIYYLYVVDDEDRLVGVVSLRDLITAQPDEVVGNMMSTQVVSVIEDMDQEKVGRVIQKYDLLAVPVISKEQNLLGIVTVDDVMDILEDETTEDFGEISAVKDGIDMELSTFKAARARSPWIIALMFLGLVTAGIVNSFEETLEQVVLLGAFIPLIMDSAGNAGTQSLAVAVRGLTLGHIRRENIGRIIRREFGIGFILGVMCLISITILIILLYKQWILAVIVGVSLLCTLSISAVVGVVIPLLTNKLKLDPAIASGPFITTVNDILGLFIYFSIATALLDYL
ncbi:magnesium transporter [Virgibacillus soli]|uniref:Magnesium transporter MgtE n=1 Tax=Paracerasibacillus soli TaxID=480284 RepID=A0ABU5CRH6_9BACI|nr:magnesium transporter [Virgibacillus soli]MDY0408979.1 magnesium transporter [Virgibacillus soli]